VEAERWWRGWREGRIFRVFRFFGVVWFFFVRGQGRVVKWKFVF
jgi:hypothetical protein